ncbi:FkbM family methyltransferase [Microcoleus sp. Pol14C2]|uniref:FkbM family methyltransferase n=1 Tax=unclassified Microcoleus TaxID=2642155 RepID=UPI002FD20D11
MNYPLYSLLILPYTRRELPGWGKLMTLTGVYRDDLWKNAPIREIRGKFHGYRMAMDLSKWNDRMSYFLGRYYDLPTQLFIQNAVQPGDSFIDAGANTGMITLLAAYHTGTTGCVHSFEPNPLAFQKLKAAVTDNELQKVSLHQCGLSNERNELTLTVPTDVTGLGTFAQLAEKDRSLISNQYQVPVYPGDEMLPDNLPGATFIKIDVEGFEVNVIKGFSQTLQKLRPAVLTEVVGSHLERAGSSVAELCSVMDDFGYEAFNLEAKREGLGHRLQLSKAQAGKMTDDVVWLYSESPLFSRLQQWMTH